MGFSLTEYQLRNHRVDKRQIGMNNATAGPLPWFTKLYDQYVQSWVRYFYHLLNRKLCLNLVEVKQIWVRVLRNSDLRNQWQSGLIWIRFTKDSSNRLE